MQKGKFHPRTGHEGPEGEQRYSSTLSSTLALDGGVGGHRHTPAALHPGKRPGTLCTGSWVAPRPLRMGVEILSLPHQEVIPALSRL